MGTTRDDRRGWKARLRNEQQESSFEMTPDRMNTPIAALGVVFLVPGIAQSLDETEKDRIVTIQKEWAEARVKRDIAYLERLYATEFRVQTMTGAVASREDDIALFRAGK